MTSTILLAKTLGLFMIIVGTGLVLKRRDIGEVIVDFAHQRSLRVLFSAIELLAGLFLVVIHCEWSSPPAVIISLVGWACVLESTAYFTLPDRMVEPFILAFSKPTALAAIGVAVFAVGAYLAAYGFGLG
jgi:hypothetical protein